MTTFLSLFNVGIEKARRRNQRSFANLGDVGWAVPGSIVSRWSQQWVSGRSGPSFPPLEKIV